MCKVEAEEGVLRRVQGSATDTWFLIECCFVLVPQGPMCWPLVMTLFVLVHVLHTFGFSQTYMMCICGPRGPFRSPEKFWYTPSI